MCDEREERDERTAGGGGETEPAAAGPIVQIGGGADADALGDAPEGADATDHAAVDQAAADPDAPDAVPAGAPGMINVRNLSVKCGHCDTYQTLASFARRGDGWNVYTYECENDVCDPAMSRTLIEVPEDLDEFARRDAAWRGGRIHAGGG
jgi:hypothetical protein